MEGQGEGKAGQRANIDALTMQANYVLVRVWRSRDRRWCGDDDSGVDGGGGR